MNNYLDALDLELPAQSDAGKIRQQVLKQLSWQPTPTTMVSYVSSNRVLIIADETLARKIEGQLPEKMQTYLALSADKSSPSTITNGWNVFGLVLSGYLGRFEVYIDQQTPNATNSDEFNLGLLFNIANGLFDQVIDCTDQGLITAAIKPPGYHHVGGDESKLKSAIEDVGELIGEFEKPKFFNYDPDICAHGSSGIKGCNNCIDACPTEAIFSIGDKVEVNPYLCQGGGSCASACPSGAIRYSYPKAEEQIEFLRCLLRDLRAKNSNNGVMLLFYDQEHGAESVAESIDRLPEFIIPFMVEEVGSIGLDLLSCALAYGANQINIYIPALVSDQVAETVQKNIFLLNGLLSQLELSDYQISILHDLESLPNLDDSSRVLDQVATFAPLGNKRNVIRSALAHLNSQSPDPAESVPLPEHALFGQINLDQNSCTLCMACVSVCPGKALQDGGDTPALKFIEANCLQCGICAQACPETAIELEARINFDHELIQSSRPLKEEQPFRCVRCSKPFATQSMIEKMTTKLQGHWMFDNPDALKRLQMCEDCRVIDVYSDKS